MDQLAANVTAGGQRTWSLLVFMDLISSLLALALARPQPVNNFRNLAVPGCSRKHWPVCSIDSAAKVLSPPRLLPVNQTGHTKTGGRPCRTGQQLEL